MANMEKLHSEALAAKEEETKERMSKAVVCAKMFSFTRFLQHNHCVE